MAGNPRKTNRPPMQRRPNSRDPLPSGFRFSNVPLNADGDVTDTEREEQQAASTAVKTPYQQQQQQQQQAKQQQQSKGFFGAASSQPGIVSGAKVPASSPETSSAPKTGPTATIPAAQPRPTGGFHPRPQGGIPGANQSPSDLDTIGHSMKSQSQRAQEAENKYGFPMGKTIPVQKVPYSPYSYANPPPPAVAVANDTPGMTSNQDVEAGKPAGGKSSSGKGKKIAIGVLVFILLAGIIGGAVFAVITMQKTKAAAAKAPKKK